MIHKQYMDLLNTSPTFYIFLFCVNASLQGVKAIVDTKKTVRRFVLTHQNNQENKRNEGPSVLQRSRPWYKREGPSLERSYTHRQVSGAQRTWGHYLTKIFRGQFSPQFLILVKGWVVTLGEQAADNLKERRSYGDRATGHRLETWGKGFFSRINHTEMRTLRDLPKIEKGGERRERTVTAQVETQGQGFTSTDR